MNADNASNAFIRSIDFDNETRLNRVLGALDALSRLCLDSSGDLQNMEEGIGCLLQLIHIDLEQVCVGVHVPGVAA